jgi:16S rRNA (cytosine967-C5)-methyltransferase
VDSAQLDAQPPVLFDRVLVDAPCSNTGVLRRRVDVRWRLRPEDLGRQAAAQLSLLERAASRVRPDGTLVYSTCSIEPEENTEVVAAFLTRHPEFARTAERMIIPGAVDADGAFVAGFRRVVS